MKTMLALLAAIVAACGSAPAPAQDHAHHAQATEAQAPQGRRFATDAPLRRYMQDIRARVAALEHGEHGHLDAAQTTALAEGIQGDVRNIVAECRLPPEADAVLHGIIAPLAANADRLKAEAQAPGAVVSLRAALEAYAAQFDDPGTAD